jgi:hypothetical protein
MFYACTLIIQQFNSPKPTAALLPPPPTGAGHLAHITGDAVFLVRQVGNNFAFASPG